MTNIAVTASVAALSTAYSLYHVAVNDTVIYIGVCPLHRILELSELGRNATFRATITRDTPLTIREITRYPDKQSACDALATRLATSPLPVCNRPATNAQTGRRVRGPGGEIYDNAAQAATANGISKSAMSNHLTGRAGYATVHGKRYERIPD